jgi:hydroxypyruvate reductase
MKQIHNDIRQIFDKAVEAARPVTTLHDILSCNRGKLTVSGKGPPLTYDLSGFSRVLICGAGKASAAMARGVEEVLGDTVSGGIVVVKHGHTDTLSRTIIHEASHPVPDESCILGAQKVYECATNAGKDDLVIALISGGGSSLLALPAGKITLEEKRAATNILLRSGASIHEMNTVRKHLSDIKGGNLARAAFPATVLVLAISDVVGDNLDVIASGPLAPDNSTFHDALAVITKYGLQGSVPPAVISHLTQGSLGIIPETPKPGDPIFENIKSRIIASNIVSLEAAREEAVRLGYNTIILSSAIEGDTAETASWHAAILNEILASSHPLPRPCCILSGGETTVRVKGNGLGGRNMEFTLQMARHLRGKPDAVAGSIGTDGTDGPTDAAGAIADGGTVDRGIKLNLDIDDFAARNDSYHYFDTLGDLIRTGPTNTNVMDVRAMIVR